MQISRRTALAAGAAAITTAAVTAPLAIKAAGVQAALAGDPAVAQAADPEEAQVLAVFRQLNDGQRAVVQMFMRCLARLPADPMINARVDKHLKPVREAGS